jgi:hypothetical protein
MRKRALSQHVALVSVKRDRAKEGLRINEGLGAVSSLLRAEMFERQICQDGCGVSASQDQAFSSFQRQVKMSRRGAAGARHKTCLACFERRCSSARSVKMGAVRRPAGIKRFRVSRGKSRCRDGVPRAHVTRCLVLRAEMCERKIIELQMSRCGAALVRIKVSASRGERKIIEL